MANNVLFQILPTVFLLGLIIAVAGKSEDVIPELESLLHNPITGKSVSLLLENANQYHKDANAAINKLEQELIEKATKKAGNDQQQRKLLEKKLASIQKVVEMKRGDVDKEYMNFISSGIEKLTALVQEISKVNHKGTNTLTPSSDKAAANSKQENADAVRKTLTQLLNEDDEQEHKEQQDITRRLVQKMEAQQAEEAAKVSKAAATQLVPGTAHFQTSQSEKTTQKIKRQKLVIFGVVIFLFIVCILMVFVFKLLGVSTGKDESTPIPKTKYDA